MDEDELYYELAIWLPESSMAMHGPSALQNLGRRRFADLRMSLYRRICLEAQFCSKLDDPQINDAVTLVSTLADVIASSTIGVPVPAIVLASLIVRMGIRKFCSSGGGNGSRS